MILLSLPVMAQKDKDHEFKIAKNLDVFSSIYKGLDMLYVDTLDADTVIGNGIQAMLRSLDPYTEYYPESEVQKLKMMVTGKYAGIGALIRFSPKYNCSFIEEPYENMPAAEAGLKKGDLVLAIDNESMMGRSTQYVSDRLRGDAGTSFVLRVKRLATGKELKVKIVRRAIQMPSVPYYGMVTEKTGYISLTSFTENCSKDVRNAFIELKKQGMKSLVFDLRNNGGGLEQEAVNIVNMFVRKGVTVVSNRGKLKRMNHEYKTTVEPLDTIMPIVVLVNGNSASASEITSGALQDLDRAVIMGTRTFGKGLVQMTIDTPYNGNLKLTTNKYYIPSGRCIQAINYKHNRGGYIEHVPDSLTKVFYTAGGREVRDGGGIKPDVVVHPDTASTIQTYLFGVMDSTETVLDYVANYIAEHPTIAPASEFEISDEEYENFKNFVAQHKYHFTSITDRLWKQLVEAAKIEGYYDDAKAEFDSFAKNLKHDMQRDLDLNKKDVKEALATTIIPAYYFQRGGIIYALRHDRQFSKAIELLKNESEYNKCLTPNLSKEERRSNK